MNWNSITNDVPAAKYHADDFGETPTLSSSIANILLARSPLHAWQAHPKLNVAWQAEETTSEMDIGSAAHVMLLEPEKDETGIVIVEADDWRTKDAKAQRDLARLRGKIPILRRRFHRLRQMADIARKQLMETAIQGAFDYSLGKAEVTMLWRDGTLPTIPSEPSRTAFCRSRLDWISDDKTLVIDYKTTENAEPNAFSRRIAQMGYDVQAAFYSRGVLQLTGKRPRFLFMAQETEPPYLMSTIELDNIWMDLADRKVETAIAKWSECLASNNWPGYPTEICTAIMPAWLASQWEEKSAMDEELIDYGSQA